MTASSARARRFVADESGVTAIEYGLLASLIAVVMIGGLAMVGSSLDRFFTYVRDEVAAATGRGP
jgi:pilus assembly protein Flp/PilA